MKKKPTIAALKKRVWKLYSLMVRLEESDNDGMTTCVACLGEGKITKIHYKSAHASHFIPKSQGLRIYFERRNTHVCCVGCNMFKHGNLSAYAVWMKNKYGADIFDELMKLKNDQIGGGMSARIFLEEVERETKEKLDILSQKNKI